MKTFKYKILQKNEHQTKVEYYLDPAYTDQNHKNGISLRSLHTFLANSAKEPVFFGLFSFSWFCFCRCAVAAAMMSGEGDGSFFGGCGPVAPDLGL